MPESDSRMPMIAITTSIYHIISIWVFPKIGNIPKCMVKIMENPIKVDDLGVPLFSETSIYSNLL